MAVVGITDQFIEIANPASGINQVNARVITGERAAGKYDQHKDKCYSLHNYYSTIYPIVDI
jgi:hypothetical protein